MTHYKCSINPRSNTLQLTANTFQYLHFFCLLSRQLTLRHMFAQYLGCSGQLAGSEGLWRQCVATDHRLSPHVELRRCKDEARGGAIMTRPCWNLNIMRSLSLETDFLQELSN